MKIGVARYIANLKGRLWLVNVTRFTTPQLTQLIIHFLAYTASNSQSPYNHVWHNKVCE